MAEVTNSLDLYDSEIPLIEEVLRKLNEKSAKYVPMEPFRKEIIGRFEEIGLVVSVKVYTTADEGGLPLDDVYAFDIDIYDRCERKPFDWERMHYEVVNDVAGIEPDKKGVKFEVPEYVPPEGHHHH